MSINYCFKKLITHFFSNVISEMIENREVSSSKLNGDKKQ